MRLNNGAVLVLAVSVIRVRSPIHNGCAWKRHLAPLFFRTHCRWCWCNRVWIPALSNIIPWRNLRFICASRLNACLLLLAAYYITVISRSHRTIRYAFGIDNVGTGYMSYLLSHTMYKLVLFKAFYCTHLSSKSHTSMHTYGYNG